MTPAIAAGIAIVAIALSGTSQTPTEAPGPGKRVESDSDTAPGKVTRCIVYNINRKMPELQVRTRPGESPEESGYLILTAAEPSPATFGVIRVEPREAGSHLTTWLPQKSLTAAPEAIAHRLIAGC